MSKFGVEVRRERHPAPSGSMTVMANADSMTRVVDLLIDNIRTEVDVQNVALGLGLTGEAVGNLADCIAAEVLYAFEVDWAPDWLKPGGVHAWESSGEHFSLCGICLQESPPFATFRSSGASRPAGRVGLPPGNQGCSPCRMLALHERRPRGCPHHGLRDQFSGGRRSRFGTRVRRHGCRVEYAAHPPQQRRDPAFAFQGDIATGR